MKKLLRVSAFVLALSVCALADDGIIQSGKATPAPTPTTATQTSEEPTEAADGIIQTGAAEAAIDVSLGLLRSLLTIF